MRNIETARYCLRLIRDIAERGSVSWDPVDVGYALQELRQILSESASVKNRRFEPLPANEIADLDRLCTELQWADQGSRDMCGKKLWN
jgi:hypothetical protein